MGVGQNVQILAKNRRERDGMGCFWGKMVGSDCVRWAGWEWLRIG